MPFRTRPRRRPLGWLTLVALLGILAPARDASADQVDMQNGDRYVGKVISLNSDYLIFRNEVLGSVRLPRTNVAAIVLGSVSAPTRPPVVPPVATLTHTALTNSSPDFSETLRQMAANTNLVRQVQNQILGGAGPEANAKFNELLSGLANGQISLGDLRAQAASAADQLRAVKKDLGGDAGEAIDGYLEILDDFLKESGGAGAASTNVVSSTAGAPRN